MLIKDKFSSPNSDLKEVEDRFGDEGWGVKKFVNAKKPDTNTKTVLTKNEEPTPNPNLPPQDAKPKGKQFLDKNNMFSILPKN